MMQVPTDARLLRRAAAGEERAFEAIFERYQAPLYRFCLSILGRPEDAQDALQNTMVKALRALPGEKREIELRPWLYRVAHNESIEVLRKRHEAVELQPETVAGAADPGETAALRDRLRRLLDDLGQLPERQRSALVMRELGGLGFEQIGEAFETSAAVARQTIYEARLSLRQLEEGREMGCEQVTRQLSDADGRVLRRRDVQAHLRDCPECRAFRDSIASRRHDLAALAPLPAASAGAILHGLLGSQAGTGTAGAAAAGAGKAVATSALVKGAATVAVVATIGVTAADRGGLIDAGLPGGGSAKSSDAEGSGGRAPTGSSGTAGATLHGGSGSSKTGVAAAASKSGQGGGNSGVHETSPATSPGTSAAAAPDGSAPGETPGHSDSLPAGAQHGQETAAAHRSPHAANAGHGHRTGKANAAHSGHNGGSHGGGHHSSHAPAKDPGGGKAPAGPPPSVPATPPQHGKGTTPSQAEDEGEAQTAPEPSTTDGQEHGASP
jgi:RNA polymerase sigma factor (sigma-70 family)